MTTWTWVTLPGGANVGDKAMTLIHSALADVDSIDDADALRAGATQAVLGHAVATPPPSAPLAILHMGTRPPAGQGVGRAG